MAKVMRTTYILILFCVTFNKRVAAQIPSCGTLDFYTTSGTISSPNYPGNYTNNLNCNYTITVGSSSNSVSITFQALDIQGCCDWVQIFCGNGQFYQSPRFSGTSIPPATIVSSCSRIIVWFQSDASLVGKGFSLSYGNCGNTAFSGQSGTITSPNYPNSYYNNLACNYTITIINVGLQPYTVLLTFQAFDIVYDSVQIFCTSGQSFNSPKYSNNVQPQVLTLSSCNRVVVTFTTTSYWMTTGFSLNYQVLTRAISGGFLTKPINVFAPIDSTYPSIFNCTSNTGYTPSWSFNPSGSGNSSLTTSLCAVSVYSGYSSWLKTESRGPGDCNLIISAPVKQLMNLAGVFICTDSTLTSSSAVFIPYNLAMSSASVNGSQTLPSEDFLQGDRLNMTCRLEISSYYAPSPPGTFIYQLVYGTSLYQFSVLGSLWFSNNGDMIPGISTSKTSSYAIVTAPSEALPSYTCNFSLSLFTNTGITSAASNYPNAISKNIYIKVKYWPVEENMKIAGDTNGAIPINGTLTCYVPANPPATYIWLDGNGNYINGQTIIVYHRGNYICNASNIIRGQVYQASKSITVQTISSLDVQSTQEGRNLLPVIIGISVGAGVLIILLLIIIVIVCVRANRKGKIKTNENGNEERNNSTNHYDVSHVTRRQRTSDRNVEMSSYYSTESYEVPVVEISRQPNVHSIYANI